MIFEPQKYQKDTKEIGEFQFFTYFGRGKVLIVYHPRGSHWRFLRLCGGPWFYYFFNFSFGQLKKSNSFCFLV